MSYKATQFCDSQTVIKTFERGAAYCPTEQSVYAMLTIPLQNMRTSAGAFVKQSELFFGLSNPTTAKNKAKGSGADGSASHGGANEQGSGGLANSDKATEDDGGYVQNIIDPVQETVDQFVEDISPAFSQPVQDTVDDIEAANWYKDCIGCDIRLTSWDEMKQQVWTSGLQEPFIQALKEMLNQALGQIAKMKELFDGDPYLDLCNLINWLKEYVCLPDLARIVSVLMALLSRMAFDFGGVVGIMISLIAPLIQPFLTNLVNSLESYIFMVIRPIECIIEQFQKLLASGDMLLAFEANLDSVDFPITTRRDGKVTDKAFGIIDIHGGGTATKSGTAMATGFVKEKFDVGISTQERINVKRAENQQRVEAAAQKIEDLDKKASKVNIKDKKAVEDFNKKSKEAREEYNQAVEQRDLSTIQRVNKRIDEAQQIVKSSILQLMKYLREGAQLLEAYIYQLWDELKKLTLEFGGGHNSFLADLLKKMGIVQMIQLVYALIKNFGLKGCENPSHEKLTSADFDFANTLGDAFSSLYIWTDETGDVHIEDSDNQISTALEEVVQAFGSDTDSPIQPGSQKDDIPPLPPGDTDSGTDAAAAASIAARAASVGEAGLPTHNQKPISSLANSQDLRQTDRGNSVTEARQKLNSLIQLTGDPILDSQIARATEAAVSRTNVTFRCPLQTSVANAEQVNKWISELDE